MHQYSRGNWTAIRDYKKAVAAIDPSGAAVVLPIIVGDEGGAEVTISALAKKTRRCRNALMCQFRLALEILADFYEAEREKARMMSIARRRAAEDVAAVAAWG